MGKLGVHILCTPEGVRRTILNAIKQLFGCIINSVRIEDGRF